MQIAASEDRSGHQQLADELKTLIDKAKKTRLVHWALSKLSINAAQKELNDLLELVRPEEKLQEMVLYQNWQNP